MAKPIAVFFADAHLDPYIWNEHKELREDSFVAFQYVLRRAKSLGVKQVFVAGDVINVKKPHSSVVRFVSRMHRYCQKAGLHLHFIQGQHDLSDPPWLSSIGLSHFHHLDRQTVEIEGIAVRGYDWRPRSQLLDALDQDQEQIQQTDLLVLHQVWQELMGGVTQGEVTARDIPPGPRTVVSGDYHVTLEEQHANSQGEPFQLISPGSTHIRSITEPLIKHYYVLHDNARCQKQTLRATRKVMVYNVRTTDAVEYLKENLTNDIELLKEESSRLPAPIRTPLIGVRYYPEFYPDLQPLTLAIREAGAYPILRPTQALRGSHLQLDEDLTTSSLEADLSSRTRLSVADRIEQEVEHPIAKEILLRALNHLEEPIGVRQELQQLKEEYFAQAQKGMHDASEED